MLPRVRAATLSNYSQVARSVGLNPADMLRRAGLSGSALKDPEEWLAGHHVVDLLEASARVSGCNAFGLLLAESRSLATVGALSLLFMHQRNAREIIEAAVQYQGLMSEAIVMSFETMSDTAVIRMQVLAGLDERQSVETFMGACHRVLREVVGRGWQPEAAHFVHDAPEDLSVHRRVFACPLAFSSEFNGFIFSVETLDAPNSRAEADMARNAERYIGMLVEEPADRSLAEHARRSIARLLPAGRASIARVSEDLGVAQRTLQRSLDREGYSFAILLNEVRHELAARYLSGSSHSITSIAQMTGYGTPSSFTRWFRSEFGTAPAAWRIVAQLGRTDQ